MLERKLFQYTGYANLTRSNIWAQIVESYSQDPYLQKLCQELQSQSHTHPNFSWDWVLLKRKGKVVVGSALTLRKTLFDLFHREAIGSHLGTQATRHRLASIVY